MQKLHKYQNTGKTFLKMNQTALLADEQGLGKTAQALCAARELELTKVLIICPASVKYVWEKEIKKWAPGTLQVISSGKDRLGSHTYTIINYELLLSKKLYIQLLSKHFDLIICDEAHYLKNFKAKRTKCVYYPKGLKDRTDRVWLMTGTPILNRPVELFSHLKALAPEKLGQFTSFIEYCKRYCAAYEGKWGWDVTGASNMEELSKRLNGFMIRREKKDVLTELPDKTFQTINFKPDRVLIEIHNKERKHYERKEKDNMLGELASLRRQSGIEKVEFILSHIEDILETTEKIVIFAYHKDVITRLMDCLRKYSPVSLTGATPNKRRQSVVDRFRNEPSCRVFIGQIQAAGTGIDGLQDVCSTVIFAEMSWVPGQIHQAVDRCHRIGQRNPVLVQFLVATGSIDEEIAESVAQKERVIKKIIKPNSKEEDMEKKFAVSVTVEVEAVTIADAIMSVNNGMVTKDATITKVHGAVEVPSVADLRQKVEAVTGKPIQAPQENEVAPEPKKKAAPKKKAPVQEEDILTPEGLMQYCNGKLMAITPATERTKMVKSVTQVFKDTFGVASVKQIPADRVAEAKELFDTAIGGE